MSMFTTYFLFCFKAWKPHLNFNRNGAKHCGCIIYKPQLEFKINADPQTLELMNFFWKLNLHFSTRHKLTNSHQNVVLLHEVDTYYIKKWILETFHIMLSCGWFYLRKICNLSIDLSSYFSIFRLGSN